MRTIIQNGTIVSDTAAFRADLLLEDGMVKAVGAGLSAPDAQVIDASGKYVLPGAVDVHTHMDLQAGAHRAVDDFYTGTVAAACGGTTTIVDHMAFGPKGCSLWHQVEEYHRLADGKAVIDYGFHGVLQHVDHQPFFFTIYIQGMEVEKPHKMRKFKDFYISRLCSNTIVSTCTV